MAWNRGNFATILALSLAMLGGALPAAHAADTASTTLWEARWQYVRLVPRDGGPPNRHPAPLRKSDIRSALAQIKLDTGGGEPVEFLSPEERDFYADQAGKALAQAGPGQDVVICSIGMRKGVFGLNQPKVTTARLFIDEAGLNVVVGEALTDAPDDNTYVKVDPRLVSFADGRRSGPARAGSQWKLVGTNPAIAIKRADWAVIPAAVMAVPEPGSPDAQRNVQDQVQQMQQQMQQMKQHMDGPAPLAASTIEQRLRTLDELKAKGLVSPEEYAGKRRDILNAL
jgi:hypothetical protein